MSSLLTGIMHSYNNTPWQNETFLNLTEVFQDYAKGMTLGTEPSEILLVFLYSVVFMISFFGNVSVLLLITLTRKLRNITNMLLSNMAVADLSGKWNFISFHFLDLSMSFFFSVSIYLSCCLSLILLFSCFLNHCLLASHFFQHVN